MLEIIKEHAYYLAYGLSAVIAFYAFVYVVTATMAWWRNRK